MREAIFQRRRAPKLPPPAQIDDPVIGKAMTVSELKVPAEDFFKPVYTEDDLVGLDRRDRRVLRAVSVLEQWSIWHTETVASDRAYLRQMEADVIQLRLDVEKLKTVILEQGLKIAMARWIAMTIGAAVIAALLKIIFDTFVAKK